MSARVLAPILVLLATASAAQAAGGGPLYMATNGAGVAVPGSSQRFVTMPVGADTLLLRMRRDGGQVTGSRLLHGRLGIPTVAMDGTPGGLSADGRWLVLIKPLARFPVHRSQFAIVDASSLHVERFSLRGEWGFDAISQDGMSLYLTQYPFANDPSRYAVRRYEVGRLRLVPGTIVDKREPDEKMRGSAITRVMSPRGRWAYTLYDGMAGTGHPFVHALDTKLQRAFCIDVDSLQGYPDLYSLRMAWTDGEVQVLNRGDQLAGFDPATLRLSRSVGAGA